MADETKVQWGKAEKGRTGRVSYRSKCGRFRVEKRTWCLPTSRTSYELYYVANGVPTRESLDTLTEAKEAAAYMLSPEGVADGYVVTVLPEGEVEWHRIAC